MDPNQYPGQVPVTPPQPPTQDPVAAQQPTVATQPAQPPADPQAQSQYGFIFNESHPQKAPSSMMKRILIVVGGLVVLAIIGAVVMSLLTPKSTAPRQLASLVQEQQEIIRVAGSMNSSLSVNDNKDFSLNTSMSISSDQAAFNSRLAAYKSPVPEKQLGLKADPKTDELLANAKASNTYDRTAVQQLQTMLVTYRDNLNVAHQSISNENDRKVIKAAYDNVDLLIKQASQLAGP